MSNFKHGHASKNRTSTYTVWKSMRQRCLNPKNAAWPSYGGRGISICERWNSFPNFLSDMGVRPPGLTLERKDNGSGYEPDNCKWATRSEQGRNKRNSRIYTVQGVTGFIDELALHFHLDRSTIYRRLNKGWPVERAFTVPPDTRKVR